MAQSRCYSDCFQSEFGDEDSAGFPDWLPSEDSAAVRTYEGSYADLQATRDYSSLRARRPEKTVPDRIGDSREMRKGEIVQPSLPSDHGSVEEPEVGFVTVTARHSNLRHIHWEAVSQAGGFEAARPSNHILGLDACGNLATTLDGIECYPWLLSLDVSQNDLRSLRAHRLPFTLTHIDLSHNVLLSLEGLQELPYLSWLNAGHNYLEDVTPLSRCFKLKHLRLGNNNIQTLEGLEGLQDLVLLELDHNQITKPSEVRSLSPLRSLLSLTLASNPVDSKPKAMRTLCMGLLPSLTSLDGVKIIRVASVRSPAKSYSQLYSRGGITPGMKGGNSKKQKAAGKNSNLVDLQPLFTIKPSGSSSGSTMPSGSFPVHHQIKECNIEGVSYSPRQWLENILQDSADLHGLQWVMQSSAAKPRAPVSPATPDDRRWSDEYVRAAELSWRAKAAEIAHMRRQQAAKDIHTAKKEYSDALKREDLRTIPFAPEEPTTRKPLNLPGRPEGMGCHRDTNPREMRGTTLFLPGMFLPPSGAPTDEDLLRSLVGSKEAAKLDMEKARQTHGTHAIRSVPLLLAELPNLGKERRPVDVDKYGRRLPPNDSPQTPNQNPRESKQADFAATIDSSEGGSEFTLQGKNADGIYSNSMAIQDALLSEFERRHTSMPLKSTGRRAQSLPGDSAGSDASDPATDHVDGGRLLPDTTRFPENAAEDLLKKAPWLRNRSSTARGSPYKAKHVPERYSEAYVIECPADAVSSGDQDQMDGDEAASSFSEFPPALFDYGGETLSSSRTEYTQSMLQEKDHGCFTLRARYSVQEDAFLDSTPKPAHVRAAAYQAAAELRKSSKMLPKVSSGSADHSPAAPLPPKSPPMQATTTAEQIKKAREGGVQHVYVHLDDVPWPADGGKETTPCEIIKKHAMMDFQAGGAELRDSYVPSDPDDDELSPSRAMADLLKKASARRQQYIAELEALGSSSSSRSSSRAPAVSV